MTIDRRLSRLEAVEGVGVSALIGRYFDELTPAERARWSLYRFNVDASTVAEVELAVRGNLHFRCDRRPTPPTKAEYAAIVKEVEKTLSEVMRCD